MPKFSLKSNDRLNTCHHLLQMLFRAVVKDDDCAVIEGHRPRRRQNQLHKQGKSKVRWPNGKHNVMPSEAGDVGPYVKGIGIPWDDHEAFYAFALKVQKKAEELGIQLRWGGDWDGDGDFTDQNFNDLVHWELLSTEQEE